MLQDLKFISLLLVLGVIIYSWDDIKKWYSEFQSITQVTIAEKISGTSETQTAVKALRKLQAAIEVGINMIEYNKLVIEAKAEVNEIAASIVETPRKKAVRDAMQGYVDAWTMWSSVKRDDQYIYAEPVQSLVAKYSIPTEKGTGLHNSVVDRTLALARIWAVANQNTNYAISLAR